MARKKRKIPLRLTSMFKMTPEQLALRKTSGGGPHKSGQKYKTRGEQKRGAIKEELGD